MSHYPQASFLTSAHQSGQFVADKGKEVAVAGRSNAGKSSAINTIVNQRNFARVSKSPGRTQLINFFSLQDDRRLVDLPGYGYARVPESVRKHWRELMGAYFEQRQSLVGLFVVVDIRRSLSDFDWQMIDWAQQISCPAHVLLTKADKLKRGSATNTLLQVRKELGDTVTVQFFSALKRTGVDEARKTLDLMLL
ncbi:MAG: YihA family ribosome biogenesis GTP-binding protein [Gammaproteobacteria bacterium]|nr:YihA family ribosome biogenesis GTP-binding protein [Gammaproteobacteria bacterium]MCP4276166.1 YihA family ribosome biogenesis GTP-binding protein [Gammaproteobacteria bacterium]MCP4831800.1 YihA family ribosome biogenesis GTP-binding protein [Gammaproteobacteria bacterium]MCP4929736.1 YihA family ribosome biogenesis GTP-binding protein [Gammaproteobacteria bacterium]